VVAGDVSEGVATSRALAVGGAAHLRLRRQRPSGFSQLEDPRLRDRDPAGVGREHEAGRFEQRAVGRQRLHPEHVERGTGEVAAGERTQERFLVDEAAARGG